MTTAINYFSILEVPISPFGFFNTTFSYLFEAKFRKRSL